MEGWILSFQQTLFYREFLAELPAPLNNVYLDLLVLGLLAVYLLYCIVSDVVDWAWIGKVSRAGRKTKAAGVLTDGEGDGAVTAFSAEVQDGGVAAAFSAEAQDVTAGADVRPAAPAEAVAAPQSVKSRMSQIWVKQREIEGLRKEIGTPGKLSREEALAALARIAEIKEEIERIKWEMYPPGDSETGINSTEEKAEAAAISEDAKCKNGRLRTWGMTDKDGASGSSEVGEGKNGCANTLEPDIDDAGTHALEKGEDEKVCVNTSRQGEVENGCVSTLDSGIGGQCPDVDEGVPGDGRSEFDRLMEQYEATQKAIGLLEKEGLVEKSEVPAGRRGDKANLDGLPVLDVDGTEAAADVIKGREAQPGLEEKDKPCIIIEEAKVERQRPAGKLTDREATEVLLRGLSCGEAAEIAKLEEDLRIAAVQAALEAGASTRQVARLTGISKSTVQRIGAM